MVGWRGKHVNPLRLWSARAVDPVRLDVFNSGDHVGALSEQSRAEAISKVLYPSDVTSAGQALRLRQEYFFVSASLQDSCGGMCGSMATSAPFRTRQRSSLTTRIQASPWRS
jgi:glucan phosphorylase